MLWYCERKYYNMTIYLSAFLKEQRSEGEIMLDIWKQCNRKISMISKVITVGGFIFLILQMCIPNFYIHNMNQMIMFVILLSWSVSSYSAYLANKKKNNLFVGIAFFAISLLNIYSIINY